MDNCDAGSEFSDSNFLIPEVIEPQHRCKRKHYKRSTTLDQTDMGDIKIPKEKEKLYEENETEFLDSLKNCMSMKVTTDNVPNLGTEQHGDWVDKFVPLEQERKNETLSDPEEKSQIEHKYRNVYSISNQMKPSTKTPVDFEDLTENLPGSNIIDLEEKQNFLCNMHKWLVEYQEARGTPRTEYPFAALIQEMGQITGRCMVALLEVVISLSPLLQIFLYILRFVLDKVVNIRETNDYHQMSIKYLILGVQVLSVFFCIGFIFSFVVFPILQMGVTIIAKILFYE